MGGSVAIAFCLCRVVQLVVSAGLPRAAQLTQLSCLEQVCLQCIWESDRKSNHAVALFRWNCFSRCGEEHAEDEINQVKADGCPRGKTRLMHDIRLVRTNGGSDVRHARRS
jgi:hypothetical protein